MQIAEIDFCLPADLEALCEVEHACFEIPWEREIIAADLANPGEVVYLKAVLRERIAGYCALAREGYLGHLLNLAVLPDLRRRGIAAQLFAAVEAIAIEWGCKKMSLEVRASNRPARDFYAKIGFVYNTRLRGYYAGREDALVLVARLPLLIAQP